MKYCQNTKIISNEKINSSYYRLVLNCKEISIAAQPGQFILIKVNTLLNPLLRRPFSINKIEKNNLHIIYKIVGRGTEDLSKRKRGEYINIIGPLGGGFKITDNNLAMLVCGGYGVAPMVFLAKKLTERKIPTIVLIGAKSKRSILCEDDFIKIGIKPEIATEDGSKGHRGIITELLISHLAAPYPLLPTIYACGPYQMLKGVAEISKKFKTKCYVSVESMIACGIGSCLGCVVQTKHSYKTVCCDGPVFGGDEIIWK